MFLTGDEKSPKDVHQNKQNQNEEKETSMDDQNQEDRDVEKDITSTELLTHVLTVDVKNEEPKTSNSVHQEEQEEQDQNVEEDEEEEEEMKISDPLNDLLEAITRRCMHYLPSKTKINRLLALEVIDIALPLLFKYSKVFYYY